MKFFKKLFGKKEEFEPEILLEERSPTCPITAIVEQDHRVAYFYLWGDQNTRFQTKACWIRNLKEAPEEMEVSEIKEGNSPMMAKKFCKYPQGQSPLKKSKLKLIWTEEGDGAALFFEDEILVIIPSWSGMTEFPGYAKDCVGEGKFAWELKVGNIFPQRIEAAKSFWDLWDKEANPFFVNQPLILEKYEEALGKDDKYYATDGGEWPPKGLYLRMGAEKVVFATVGVSLLPQPQMEMHFEFPNQKNRIELGLILKNKFSETQLDEIANWISGVASIPWDNITFLGEGHTTNFEIPGKESFKAVIFTKKLNVLPKVELDPFRNSPINLLWMIPISESERTFIIENGSSELIKELNLIGEEIFNLDRKPLK